MGLVTNNTNYRRVERALDQLAGVKIYSNKAFWNKKKGKRTTSKEAISIIDRYWIRYEHDEDDIDEESVRGFVVWGDKIYESVKSGYIKNLNIDEYYSLPRFR
jgi:hypothetical protein